MILFYYSEIKTAKKGMFQNETFFSVVPLRFECGLCILYHRNSRKVRKMP